MKSISIQSVDEQLAAALRQRAAAARKSVSQFVVDTLRQHLGLDSLFGAWTEEEFSSIQGCISAERRLTGVVGELAGLLKGADVDESREGVRP